MAVPKKKYPSTRKKMRRHHDALSTPTLVSCQQCRKPHRAHTACPHCGSYNGREVIKLSTPGAPGSR